MEIINNTSYDEILDSFNNKIEELNKEKKEYNLMIIYSIIFLVLNMFFGCGFVYIGININYSGLQFFFLFYSIVFFYFVLFSVFAMSMFIKTKITINKNMKKYNDINNIKNNEEKIKKIINNDIICSKVLSNKEIYKRLNENEIDNYKINKDDGTINITYKDKNKELIDINLNINIRYFDEIEKEELIINNNSIDMKIKY